MNKEIKCPWCTKKIIPNSKVIEKTYGKVRERRCPECEKILAAYLVDEGNFMSSVRKFEN